MQLCSPVISLAGFGFRFCFHGARGECDLAMLDAGVSSLSFIKRGTAATRNTQESTSWFLLSAPAAAHVLCIESRVAYSCMELAMARATMASSVCAGKGAGRGRQEAGQAGHPASRQGGRVDKGGVSGEEWWVMRQQCGRGSAGRREAARERAASGTTCHLDSGRHRDGGRAAMASRLSTAAAAPGPPPAAARRWPPPAAAAPPPCA